MTYLVDEKKCSEYKMNSNSTSVDNEYFHKIHAKDYAKINRYKLNRNYKHT